MRLDAPESGSGTWAFAQAQRLWAAGGSGPAEKPSGHLAPVQLMNTAPDALHADVVRVLLVEDDEASARLAWEMLADGTRRRYLVDWAATGEEAAARLEAGPYDALVLDVRLPDVDGITFLQGLRAAGRTTPALVLTALSNEKTAERALLAGADEYLSKDVAFSGDALDHALASLVARRQERTARQAAEHALRESERWLGAIFGASPAAITISSLEDGRILEANEAFTAISGYSREEAIGTTVGELGLWPALEERAALVAAVRTGDPVRGMEARMRTASGEIRHVLLSADALELGGERRLLAIAQDISAVKAAEEDVRVSEARFRAYVERSAEAIAVIDAAGAMVYASPSTATVLGFTPEERLAGGPFDLLHPDDAKEARDAFAALASEPGGTMTRTCRVRHGDGTYHWMECSGTNLLDDPDVRGLVANFRDVSQRKQAEDNLLQITRRLRLLLKVATEIGPRLKVDAPLDDALSVLVEALPEADTAAILLYDPETQLLTPRAYAGLGEAYGRIRLRPGEGISGLTFQRAQTIRSDGGEDAQAMRATIRAENAAHFVEAGGGKNFTHSVCVPLRAQEGEVVGVLTMGSNRADFSDDDLRVLEGVAAQLAAALDNARLYERARRDAARAESALQDSRRLLERLASLAQALGTGRDLQAIYRAVRDFVLAETPSNGVFLSHYDAELQARRCMYAWGDEGEEDVSQFPPLPMNSSPHAQAVATGKPVLCPDFQAAVGGLPTYPIGFDADPRPPRSSLAVPMLVMGRVVGGFEVQSTEPSAYTPAHVTALSMAANLAAVAIENARLHLEADQEILERTSAELALQRANTELEVAYGDLKVAQAQVVQQERLRALGQLASGIAHDLNNTLAPVVGFSELLQTAAAHSPTLTRRHLEWLRLIHTGASDAAEVVRRLRDFYRPRDAHDVFAPVDLGVLVREAAALTRPKWKDDGLARGVIISLETGVDQASLPPVQGNAAELREALTNLIFNAVDALPRGGAITLRAYGSRGGAILEVADTGEGMPDHVRRRCLEPFFTTKGEKGTGLGLAMVHGTIQRHGGTLEIESTHGKGTLTRLRLPAAAPALAAAGVAAPTDEHGSAAGLSVLVVDDEATVRTVTAALLEADGHSVTQAADGPEGLMRLEGGGFDALVTDRAMPGGMSGEQLALAAKRLRPDLPVILLTGYGDLMTAAGEQPAGVDAVLSKPVTRATLRDTLGALRQPV